MTTLTKGCTRAIGETAHAVNTRVHGTGFLFILSNDESFIFSRISLKRERVPYSDISKWTLIQNTNLHTISRSTYGFSLMIKYNGNWRFCLLLKLKEEGIRVMMWKGMLDNNNIPLFFSLSKEELRVEWDNHFEFLDLVHPEEAVFVNSFFPVKLIPSVDCLLNTNWAMPHKDGCIGQGENGPDLFRITWPKNRFDSVNNIKDNIPVNKKLSGKRKKFRRKQRRVPVYLRDRESGYEKDLEEETTITDVVYVLKKSSKKKREDVPTFFFPYQDYLSKICQKV